MRDAQQFVLSSLHVFLSSSFLTSFGVTLIPHRLTQLLEPGCVGLDFNFSIY